MPGSFKANKEGNAWTVSLNAANPNSLKVDTGGRTIRLGGAQLSIKGTATPQTANVVVTASTKGVVLGGMDIRSGPVRLSLPLAWPAPKRHTSGKLKVSGLRYGKYKLGTASSKVRQEAMGLALDGTLFTQLLPNLRVPFSGSASMETKDASFKFDIGKYPLPDGLDLSALDRKSVV